MNDYKIYAVDFDGTLAENKWPEIGEPIQSVIDFCIQKKSEGHKLILWTCRTGEQTEQAVKWCAERGLEFDAVNANLPDEIEKYHNDPRKIGADYFIDDKNMTIEEVTRQANPLTAIKINILGTEYSISKKTYEEEPCLKENHWAGFCNSLTKEIVLLDLDKAESWKKEDQKTRDICVKESLRHEIIHAFLNESGLQDNAGQAAGSWAKNEEMVDWFAIQAPKIFKAYGELGIL